jgi:glycosyl transferase family 25
VALILEDDVYICDELIEIIQRRGVFPSDWDIINFLTDASKTPLDAPPLFKGYRICRFNEPANRSTAYLITIEGARKLLKHIYPIRYSSDGLLMQTHITGIKVYGITPNVVSLAGFKSGTWDGSDYRQYMIRLCHYFDNPRRWPDYCVKALRKALQ